MPDDEAMEDILGYRRIISRALYRSIADADRDFEGEVVFNSDLQVHRIFEPAVTSTPAEAHRQEDSTVNLSNALGITREEASTLISLGPTALKGWIAQQKPKDGGRKSIWDHLEE